MNKITPRTLKGFRDFLPTEANERNFVIEKMKKVFELYGFDPLETPALEYAETLLGKYGEEAEKLMYLFEDKGKRKIGLRYDQTVPLARIIAQYQNLSKPFKRYQIQPVWRAENTQKGRFREFYQSDIDTIGSNSLNADAEIITCTLFVVKRLGFKNVKMLINDRAVFTGIENRYIITIDKLLKIGSKGVIDELVGKGMQKQDAEKIMEKFIKNKPTVLINRLFRLLEKSGLKEKLDFEFSPTLARGLDYYTGSIFELVSSDYDAGSLGGGGRYDKLIGQFTNQDVPAVGFAFGFDRLIEAMRTLNLLPVKKTSVKALVTVFSDDMLDSSLLFLNQLRKDGINTELILEDDWKLDKQLKYADKKGIPYVIIIGPEEAQKGNVKLKNMKTGEQKTLGQEKLIKFLISN